MVEYGVNFATFQALNAEALDCWMSKLEEDVEG